MYLLLSKLKNIVFFNSFSVLQIKFLEIFDLIFLHLGSRNIQPTLRGSDQSEAKQQGVDGGQHQRVLESEQKHSSKIVNPLYHPPSSFPSNFVNFTYLPQFFFEARNKLNKAHEEYRQYMDKYGQVRDTFEERIVHAARAFQEHDRLHLLQMKSGKNIFFNWSFLVQKFVILLPYFANIDFCL